VKKVTIVALTKFPDIWSAFQRNIRDYVPAEVQRIVVVDGINVKPVAPWRVIRGPKVFSMAGNYNLGMRAADDDSDLFVMNDDITFITPDPIERLQELAYSDPIVGAVACRVTVGRVGNPLQEKPRTDRPLTFVKTCGNGCTYFKREVINEIGYMDEDLAGAYGAEDADYMWRVNMAGYRVAIARDVHVKHGYGEIRTYGATHSATSLRTLGQKLQDTNKIGVEKFKAKWGHFDVHGEWNSSYTECPHCGGKL